MISQEKIHTKRFFKRFLIIFISLLAILFTVIYITNLYSSKSELEIYKYNQNIQVSKKLDKIRSKLDTVISDINILVKYHDMINYIEKKDSVSKLYLTDLIYKIMTNKQYINQIRLLSNDGKEIIKIIRKNNTVISIDKENLQDKSHRSYFKNSLPLKINEMYITRLELNKEHNKIEIPYNPVIRFIVPVYSFDKKRYGFLVFNYSAKSLMEDTGIKQKHDINNNFMTDKEGYWLEGVDEKDKWGFILDSAKNKNIKLSNPPLWTKIQANKNGQFILSDGLYTFTKFTPKVLSIFNNKNNKLTYYDKNDQLQLVILSFISDDKLSSMSNKIFRQFLFLWILFLFFLIYLSYKLAKSDYKKKLAELSLQEYQHDLKELVKKRTMALTDVVDQLQWEIIERKKAESSLKYKLKTDDLLNTISTYFINLPSKDISDGLEHSVQAIGEFTQVDMSFLYIFNHAELNLKTYSWISTSFADSPSYLKIVSKDSIDIIKTNLSTDKLINISTLNPDADISTELYDLLRSNNIKSIIIIPVQENKKLLGFLGLCMIREVKSWKKDDISMLKLIAEVFVNALSRTTSERALKESESKFRHIFDSSPVMMHSTDNLGNINDVNNIWLSEMGYTKDEVIGKKLDEFMTEDSALKHHSVSLPSFAEYGYISKAEIKLVRKDNFKMDTLLNANMISDSSGKKMNLFVIRNITDQKRAEDEKNHSIKMLFQAMEDTIAAIAMTIEVRDPYTAGHQRRVAELAVAIAKEMNFSKDKIEGVRLAGTIHDIGKIYLPSEILSRPGRISNIEKNLLKTHAQVGYDILKPINFPWPIATMVHQHHEKLDGSGYPNGLKGEEIILEAKIICVADVVESMASHRPYRASLGIDRALDEIISHKDILYDKEVVEACVTLFRVKHYTLE